MCKLEPKWLRKSRRRIGNDRQRSIRQRLPQVVRRIRSGSIRWFSPTPRRGRNSNSQLMFQNAALLATSTTLGAIKPRCVAHCCVPTRCLPVRSVPGPIAFGHFQVGCAFLREHCHSGLPCVPSGRAAEGIRISAYERLTLRDLPQALGLLDVVCLWRTGQGQASRVRFRDELAFASASRLIASGRRGGLTRRFAERCVSCLSFSLPQERWSCEAFLPPNFLLCRNSNEEPM